MAEPGRRSITDTWCFWQPVVATGLRDGKEQPEITTTDRLPTLVCLIGPPAVGKMTVGQALCRRTGYHLFHGHVVGDVLTPYFPFGTPSFRRLAQTWRRTFIAEARQAELDLTITVAWRFDVPADTDDFRSWIGPYLAGGRVLCVELQAPLRVRQERNRTEHRRQHKNAYWVTDAYLQEINAAHRYDSGSAFPFDLPHLRLETAHLSAEQAAHRIIAHFNLSLLEDRNNAS